MPLELCIVPRWLLSHNRDFIVGIGQSVTNNRDLLSIAHLFNVAFDDDIAELFIQLDGVTATLGLFAGDECSGLSTFI